MGSPPSFSTMFSKGNNFLRQSVMCSLTWRTKSSQNGVFSLRKEFALVGANSFPYEMTPIHMGGNNENDRVASPESVPIHLNTNMATV